MKRSARWMAIALFPAIAAQSQVPRPADLIDPDRPFDQYLWITAHNAANYGSLFPNQSFDVTEQLQRGVRGLMLDIYERDGQLFTCHADCAFHGRKAPLENDLRAVSRFLDLHPEAVIALHLEDYNARPAMEAFVQSHPALFRRSFNPGDPRWKTSAQGWPTLRALIAADQRLLIMSQRADLSGSYAGGLAYFMHDQQATAENYWSLGTTIATHDHRCRPRWKDVPLDAADQPLGLPRLFVMNHFHGVPFAPHSGIDNRLDTILQRLDAECLPAAGRMPNYLAIDFIEWGDVLEFAETYNNGGLIAFTGNDASGKPMCSFSTAFERSWSLESAPRMGCEDNAISSVVFRGAHAGQRVTFHDAANGSDQHPYTVIDVLQDIAWDAPQPVRSLQEDLDTPFLRVRHVTPGPLDGRVSRISVGASGR